MCLGSGDSTAQPRGWSESAGTGRSPGGRSVHRVDRPVGTPRCRKNSSVSERWPVGPKWLGKNYCSFLSNGPARTSLMLPPVLHQGQAITSPGPGSPFKRRTGASAGRNTYTNTVYIVVRGVQRMYALYELYTAHHFNLKSLSLCATASSAFHSGRNP